MSPSIGLTSRLLFLCLVSIVSSTSAAMSESPSSSQADASSSSSSSSSSSAAGAPRNQHYAPIFNAPEQLVGGKRAYTYRSEYKRLPLYQFGLGKRLMQSIGDKRGQPFSFGLGKRTKQYAFGLGKRSSYDESGSAEPLRLLSSPAVQSMLADVYAQKLLENYLAENKRATSAGGFNFGLGKRDSDLGNILRDYDLQDRLPQKHSRDNLRYQFGLGKRDNGENLSLEEYDDEADEEDLSLGAPQLVL